MNKNRFRIIFNQLRGLMMVVAENVKSHTASAESGTNSKAASLSPSSTKNQRNMSVTVRPLAFSLMCALGLVTVTPNPFNVGSAHAEAKAATNVPGNQRPTVLTAPNGVEVVNIQTPSAAGVSRNVYEILNVPTQGMIFNNSRTNVQTELGGWIQANPWLATGSARIILNEINSSNPSYLNGYMEIAGSRAEFIIANPNGISCNGCGFINASRAILTTGIPILNGGDLIRVMVRAPYLASRYPKDKERPEWVKQSAAFIAQALSSIKISAPAGSTAPDFLTVDESQNTPIEMLAP
jgi:filamentous hemagglutinin